MNKKKLYLALPQGFCAGVERAIETVRRVLEIHGKPVYVRHEIVHNRQVVESLRGEGAIFIDNLQDADKSRPLIFSAHGVPKSVIEEAQQHNFFYIDATCPLVTKVHLEVQQFYNQGLHVVLVGHKEHVEVEGTMGQLPQGVIHLVENIQQVQNLPFDLHAKIGVVTQTTLSVYDCQEIIDALKQRYTNIILPHKSDICYATSNRQDAVRRVARMVDSFIIIGSATSSNTNRLLEVALEGCDHACRVESPEELVLQNYLHMTNIGVSAGASTPQSAVQHTINYMKQHFQLTIEEVSSAREDFSFKLPTKIYNPEQ